MQLEEELAAFYRKHGFGEDSGKRSLTVPVYTGCMLVPLPNVETRHKYLKFHDLHHLVGRYGVGRVGEGEVSAWELGTGSLLASPTLAFMNLIALSTGLVLEPRRMWRAFARGMRSRNLYAASVRARVQSGEWENVRALRGYLLEVRLPSRVVSTLRAAEFGLYAFLAMAIHALIAVPALVARTVTDIGLGLSLFEIVRPKKRVDLVYRRTANNSFKPTPLRGAA
ncbi:hypothetical protein [Xanthomonas arboricola]|uniref:hypothetical protein n=1 Tax=Xanthomonas arboricola TaxID=56448 RepID=UPI0004649DAE|nr:hypothetical protein [Xanthomonas arboricola]